MDPEIISHEVNISSGKKIIVLKPVIDHVTMTMSGEKALGLFTQKSENKWKAVLKQYWDNFFSLTQEAINDKSVEITPLKARNLPYRLNANLPVGESQFVRLFTKPTNSSQAPVRIEFNPSKLDETAMMQLAEMWKIIEYDNIPFPSLMPDARVTRLDIAIDCIGIRPTDLIVSNKHLWKSWSASSLVHGTETTNYYVTSGKSKSPQLSPKKRANLMIYDKRREQLANNVEPLHGDYEHTRIEFSLNTNCLLKSLTKKPYPFYNWQIRRTVISDPPFEDWLWQLVLDSARYRGTKAAFALLPEELQKVPLTESKHAPADLITEQKTWCHWNETLVKSNLTHLLNWAETNPASFISVDHLDWL